MNTSNWILQLVWQGGLIGYVGTHKNLAFGKHHPMIFEHVCFFEFLWGLSITSFKIFLVELDSFPFAKM